MTTVCADCCYCEFCPWTAGPFVSEAQVNMDRRGTSQYLNPLREEERERMLAKHRAEYEVFKARCIKGGGRRD